MQQHCNCTRPGLASVSRWWTNGPTGQTLHRRVWTEGFCLLAEQGYDSDGNEAMPDKSGKIEPLKALDHDKIQYQDFGKDFYTPAADITDMNEGEVNTDVRCIRYSTCRPPLDS